MYGRHLLLCRCRFSVRQRCPPGRQSTSHAKTTEAIPGGSSSPATVVDPVESIANGVGVRLTRNEMALLREKIAPHGPCPQSQFERAGQEALRTKATREICLDAIANPVNQLDKWGVRVIGFFDYAGTALFSVVGTQVAGDIGMNMVGCTLVGCVAALGGGSLNAVLYGGASSLLGKPGVRWVANPSYLLVAVTSSLITFFGWPYYCRWQANHYLENVIGKENLDEETGHIGRQAFLEAWQRDKQFRKTIRDALPHMKSNAELLTQWKNAELLKQWNRNAGRDANDNSKMLMAVIEEEEAKDGERYFEEIDDDSSGDIDMKELQRLVQRRFTNGWETYWMDTLGLSSLSIAAVIMAIRVGLSPIVAATSGVTVCFGGIFRDLLCGRDLAIGGQSYAFCTGASSTMYVVLRELALRRIIVLPLVLRTFMSAGTCVGLRGWEWHRGEPLLAPMHGRPEND